MVRVLALFSVQFFSKMDLAANFGSYKGFPYILSLLWPALLHLGPMRTEKRLRWVQALVLLVDLVAIRNGSIGLAHSIPELADRWSLKSEAYNRAAYLDFSSRLAVVAPRMPDLKGSQGAIALYPDLFDYWYRFSIRDSPDTPEAATDTMLWFEGDLDSQAERRWLRKRSGLHHYRVIGTRLIWSTKRAQAEFGPLLPALDRVESGSLTQWLE